MPGTTTTTNRSRTNLHRLNSKPQLHRRLTPTKAHKVSHGHSRKNSKEEAPPEDEDTFGLSFQQYCAVCDKIVPSTSTLYCSDECRKLDSSNPQALPLFKTDISPPVSPPNATPYRESPDELGDIVPRRSPTLRTASYSDAAVNGHRRSSSGEDVLSSGSPTYPSSFVPSSYGHARNSSTDLLHNSSSSLVTPTTPYTPGGSMGGQVRRPNPRWSSTSFSARSIDLVVPVNMNASGEYLAKSTGAGQTFASSYKTVTADSVGAGSGSARYSLATSLGRVGDSPKTVAAEAVVTDTNGVGTRGEVLGDSRVSYNKQAPAGSMSTGRGALKKIFGGG